MSSKDGASDDALGTPTDAAGTERASLHQQASGRLPGAVVGDGVSKDSRGDGGAVGGGSGEGFPFDSAARRNVEASVTRANFDAPGGGGDSSQLSHPSGMPTNCYDGDESVRMLDARIRELQARRTEIARRFVVRKSRAILTLSLKKLNYFHCSRLPGLLWRPRNLAPINHRTNTNRLPRFAWAAAIEGRTFKILFRGVCRIIRDRCMVRRLASAQVVT